MKTDVVAEAAVETAERVAKGYLNGTTRKQAYQILAATGLGGMASGIVGTLYVIKRKFVLTRRFVKVEAPQPMLDTDRFGRPVPDEPTPV